MGVGGGFSGGMPAEVLSGVTILPGDYLVAGLPPAVANARKYAWVTDIFDGQPDLVISDGANWKPVRPLAARSVGGNTNMTLKALVNSPTQILTGTLTAARTLVLDDQYAYSGARFRVKREATGLLGLAVTNLPSTTLGSMASGTWADFEYVSGAGWKQTASGGLL